MNSLVFYDFETTGLNPFHSQVIEYAFINDLQENLVSLVNPDRNIDEKITKITGIDDSMVKDETFIVAHKNTIFKFLENINKKKDDGEYIYLIAHNNDGFDRFFFKRIFRSDPKQLEFINKKIRFIDSLLLAKLTLPYMRSYSLKTLAKMYGIQEGTHRSLSDTLTLKLVYMKLVNEYSKQLNMNFTDLYNNPDKIYDNIYN